MIARFLRGCNPWLLSVALWLATVDLVFAVFREGVWNLAY